MLGFRHILLLLAFVVPVVLTSQTTLVLPRSGEAGDKGVVYNTETAVNLTLHTNGFRIGLDKGRIKTYYKTTYYHFDIGYIRHPKEIRQSVNYQTSLNLANSYVYGKQNSLYVIRGGWGTKRYLSEKARYRGIAVGYNYEFGPTLGLVKPYYLSFARRVDGITVNEEIRYSPGNEDLFLDDTRIQGRGGFFNGWDEITFSPGLHGKIGGHFALGAFEEYITALEAGIMVDVFFQEIPLMVLENNRSFFINVYVTLQLGKRK
jgi:hypothetical protein